MPPFQPPQFGPPSASLFQIYITIIPAIVAAGVVAYSWRMRSSPAAIALIVFMLGVMIWSVFGLAFYVSTDFEFRRYWLSIRAVGSSILPAAWFVMAVQYTGRRRLLSRWVWLLLITEAVVYISLNLSNDWHGLIRSNERLVFSGGNPFNYSIVKPLFWVHAAFIYSLIALGTLILVQFLNQSHGFFRWQIGVALGGLILPATAQFLSLTGTVSADLTGVGFLAAGVGFAFSVYRFGLLDLVPIARSAIAENMEDGVVVLDRDQRVVDLNPAAQAMLSASHAEIMGQPTPSVLGPVLSGDQDIKTITIASVDGAGRAYIEVRVTDIDAGKGTPGGTLVVLRDVSERIRYTLALEETEGELRALDSMKSRFFANISHEFRTPLTLILGPLDSILSRRPNDDDLRDIRTMRRNAERLQNLVEEILDLSRLEAGEFLLDVQKTELVGFLRAVLANFQSLAEMRQVMLTLASERDQISVHIDRPQMEKVFINLVSNAFRAISEEGSIEVIVGAIADDHVEVAVRDSGAGISSEQVPHVFDRFFQADDSAAGQHAGSGIGLALVREVINLHHGSIDVTSEVGVGSTFTVRMMLGSEHFSAEQISTPNALAQPCSRGADVLTDSGSTHDQSRPRIEDADPSDNGSLVLLVEDNPDMRAYIREQLGPSFQLVEAVDGEQGLAQARELVPDLVVSDVMMPIMDGFELTRELKSDERTSHVPVVLLTARADHDSRMTGLGFGADDYLAKPFNVEELIARINNLIATRRQLQRRYARMVVSVEPEAAELPKMETGFLERLRQAVEQNISDEDFRVDEFASALNVSRR